MKEQMRVKNLNEADHSFYRKLLVVGIPMVIQQVIAVTLNLADTIMVCLLYTSDAADDQ